MVDLSINDDLTLRILSSAGDHEKLHPIVSFVVPITDFGNYTNADSTISGVDNNFTLKYKYMRISSSQPEIETPIPVQLLGGMIGIYRINRRGIRAHGTGLFFASTKRLEKYPDFEEINVIDYRPKLNDQKQPFNVAVLAGDANSSIPAEHLVTAGNAFKNEFDAQHPDYAEQFIPMIQEVVGRRYSVRSLRGLLRSIKGVQGTAYAGQDLPQLQRILDSTHTEFVQLFTN